MGFAALHPLFHSPGRAGERAGALLTLAGILYYVVIYTCCSAHQRPEYVIGGGAGAMAPVVAGPPRPAAGITALYLFLVVFMWTPPHFWALALVRFRITAAPGADDAGGARRAGYPLQILWYSLGCWSLPFCRFIGMMGLLYLGVAVLLGLFLLYAVWRVWKLGGNRTLALFRISSMYLAFLFLR